jgi:hypothetical protein
MEECDDGNQIVGDLCDACRFEAQDAYEPDDTPATATAIVPSASFISDHDIVGFDDVDYFSVPLQAGMRYIIRTWGNGNSCSGAGQADTVLSLFDTDGVSLLAANDDSSSASPIICAHLDFTATATGTYYVAVSSWGTTYGDYHLQVVEVSDDIHAPNDSFALAAPISVPGTTTLLVDLGIADYFSFTAAAGQDYTVRILDSDCSAGDESDLNLHVLRADQSWLATDYEEGSAICASVSFTAPAAETIYVRVLQGGITHYGQTYSLEVSTP